MTSLVYVAVNCALIYAFLLFPLQDGGVLAPKSIVIWAVLTVLAALLFLYVRRAGQKRSGQ